MDTLNAIPGGKRQSGAGKKTKKTTPAQITWRCPKVVKVLGIVALCGVVVMALFQTFTTMYYQRNDVFMVAPEDIVVTGNATVTRDFILQCFGITGPCNGYDLVKSDVVQILRTKMPVLKNAQMTYTPGKKLELWVEERMPLARIAGDYRPPRVVDEEGVLFIYPRQTNMLPEIGGFDLPDEELMPGKSLPTQLHCMLRLLLAVSNTSTYFNSAVKRVTLLGIDPEDGLRISLLDGRKIDIAWENMASETETSDPMIQRLRRVALVLRSSTSADKKHLNAMAIDRISVSD